MDSTLITISAVNAADNHTNDDVISPNDEIRIDGKVYEDGNDNVITISTSDASENVSVSVDDKEYINQPLNNYKYVEQESGSFYAIKQDDFTPKLGVGNYLFTVKFKNITQSSSVSVSPMIEVKNVVYDYDLGDDTVMCRINDEIGINGTVIVDIDGVEVYRKTFNEDTWSAKWGIQVHNVINSDMKFGTHNIKVSYLKNNRVEPYVLETTFEYRYEFDVYVNINQKSTLYPSQKFKNELQINIYLPNDAKNKVTFKFNGNTYKLTPNKGKATLTIDASKLKVGSYKYSATYKDSKYTSYTQTGNVNIPLSIIAPLTISVGENEYINFLAHSKASGKVDIYEGKWIKYSDEDDDGHFVITKLVKSVPIKNGYGSFSLKNLNEGYHQFVFNYTIDGYNNWGVYNSEDENNVLYIHVIKNTKGFSSSISASKIKLGKSVTVKLKGTAGKNKVIISVDDKEYKSIKFSKGKISQAISSLKLGKHKINIMYYKGSVFYSKTYYVNVVKHIIKLNLSKVKVKKSAKKLTLKAKLKIDSKKAKGKKITFKFNKKKF